MVNLAIVAAAVLFVLQNPTTQHKGVMRDISTRRGGNTLDTLSAADIAVNAAVMTNLAETVAVINYSDSVNLQLNTPIADSEVVAKPQILGSKTKTVNDIVEHVVQSGDSLGSLATKYGVTSESIKWSNDLSGTTLTPGKKLLIPPISGLIYTVKSGDTPDSLARKYSANSEQIIAFNDAEVNGITVGQRIVIPGGSVPVATYYAANRPVGGFAFGTAAIYGYNGYDYGFCTWYVANRRAAIGRPVPANLGDAWTWDDRAATAGMGVNRTPAYGAVAVTDSYRRPGHVAFVERVNEDGSVWISEMNSRGQVSMTDSTPAGGWGRVDFKLIPADRAAAINYVH